ASTLIACEELNRICYGIEIEPKFVDVAVKRYLNLVGSDEDISLLRDGKKYKYEDVINLT
ncbi:MAG: DNA methylase, partial [Anaerococcus sp.]|nr:DNA methylase [Anaerococcus sp.]